LADRQKRLGRTVASILGHNNKNSAASILLILALSAVLLGIFFKWAVQYPYGWVDDDGYFYTQIAYNIATQGISSFDGVHITDGYHLLWMGVLTAVSTIVSWFTLDKQVHLFFFILPSLFLMLYIPWRFGRTVSEKIILLGLSVMGKLGMETHLLTLLFLLWIESDISRMHKTARGRILGYVLVFLIPLARVDASIMVFAFSFYYLSQRNVKKWITVNCFLALGVGLHLVLMKSIAGSWLSVASLIKSSEASWKPDLLIENLIVSGTGYTLRAAVLILLAALSAFFLFSNWSSKKNKMLFFVFLGAAVFSFGHLYLSWLTAWYYVPGHLVLAYLVFQAEPSRVKMIRWVKAMAVGVLYASIIGYTIDRVYNTVRFRNDAKAVGAFISKIEHVVPEGELIFQRDGSGYTGYFSKRSIFNGDGLVNNHEYARLVVRSALGGVLEKEKLHYLISNIPIKGDTIDDYRGLVLLSQNFDKVLVKEGYWGHFFTNFVLYKRK
jgi:hypothetical protein